MRLVPCITLFVIMIWLMNEAPDNLIADTTHSQSVILTAFRLQKWLQERGSLLRYTYVACLLKYLNAQSTTVKDCTFCDASVTSPSHILMIAIVSLH
jgi:hypothetical protein